MKLDAYILPESIEIYFQRIPGELSEKTSHFEEKLGYGKGELVLKNLETWKLFDKYNLTVLRKEKYPAIINFAIAWVCGGWDDDPDDSSKFPNGVKYAGHGRYEIEIGDASDIQKLYADPEFKKLNARYTKEAEANIRRLCSGKFWI
jgi:hypothetical protein